MSKLAPVLALLLAGPALACGADSDCAVDGGDYRIALPATGEAATPAGAIVFLHGWQGSPEDTMAFAALRAAADRLGVALIAPRGLEKGWSLPGALPGRRDEAAFLGAVVTDAAARFAIDPERVMISGFSLGGSMTWYLACAEGARYAGYAPIAGSFWEPYVTGCATPLPWISHVHGLADEMVPMAGRKLSMATQGDTWRSFALLREFSGCGGGLQGAAIEGALTCARQDCGGAVQELCLHDGGHSIRPEWIERAWRALAAAKNWE